MSTQSNSVCEAISSRDRVVREVKQIVAEISGLTPDKIQESQTLLGDLAWDSLDVVECAMEVEEFFDVSVPDEMTDQARTVGDVVNGVLLLLAQTTAQQTAS